MQCAAGVPTAMRLAVPVPSAAGRALLRVARGAAAPRPRHARVCGAACGAARRRSLRSPARTAPPGAGVAAPLTPGGGASSDGSAAAAATPAVFGTASELDASGGLVSAAVAAICLVESAETRRVGTAADVAAALGVLSAALDEASAAPLPFGSAVLRLEVSLPRGTDALDWLRSLPPQAPELLPQAFFAPRAPPPSPGGGSAGVHLDAPPSAGPGDGGGGGAAAGAGAAWAWRGAPGVPFDAPAAARVRRFVSTGAARTRALGGARFDAAATPATEWSAFGAYFFVLPLLELSEGPHAATLALTLAWDDGLAAPVPEESERGARCAADAVAAARRALAAAAAAAPAGGDARVDAGGDDVARAAPLVAAVEHTPSEQAWTDTVDALLRSLSTSAEESLPPVPGPAALEALARLAASNGGEVAQQVLAAAADSRSSNSSNSAASGAASGAAWAALSDLARSASGRAALEELAGRSGGETALEDLAERAALGGGALRTPQLPAAPAEEAADVDPVPIEVLTGEMGAAAPPAGRTDNDAGGGAGAASSLLADEGGAAGVPSAGGVRLEGEPSLTKVVLARRSDVALGAPVAPLALLAALRRRSPGAYAFALRPSATSGTFIGVSPERLFALEAGRVATEAVAGTRPRGGDERADAAAAYEMLTDAKEHAEQRIVQEWVRAALAAVCRPGSVTLEAEKQLLRAGAVQHLYSRLSGALAPGATEADVLAALHPTPAVCGAPRRPAAAAIAAAERFDRGFYAGPIGTMGAGSAEFAVAIRSALAHDAVAVADVAAAAAAGPGPAHATSAALVGTCRSLSLYAGVGVVRGAAAAAEWRELNLKISQYQALLVRAPDALHAPNVNAAFATLLVEEAVRCGVRLFCIAPGSRSTPLALAAARHPRATSVVCLDERSLAFHALGASKAGRLAAVITSSGTAVANLLPAAVEASEAEVPLLLLTADRPPELRDSGANQTIHQPGIFSSFVRWAAELPPPDGAGGTPGAGRQLLTTVDQAVARARGPPAGPVHLNCAFREPLAPSAAPWAASEALAGLERWRASGAPLTTYAAAAAAPGGGGGSSTDCAAPLARLVAGARRGIVVAGHLPEPADALAVAQLAARLGWPLVADVGSGLRVRARSAQAAPLPLLPHFDLALMERAAWPVLAPDCVLQFGGRLTSKRVQAFCEWAALEGGAAWAFCARHPWRHDPGHAVALRLQAAPAAVAEALLAHPLLSASAQPQQAQQAAYVARLRALDAALRRAVDEHLDDAQEGLTEMAVARLLSRTLPDGHGLFLGNSMPIRDMDMYADVACDTTSSTAAAGLGVGAPVACNRGASGIDGVLSSAAGFAAGLGRPTTLLIGDVSFAHDANGLLLLRERPGQPPLTAVVVNNGGGGIFNFLPVAGSLDAPEFARLFSTPPDVRLAELCRAHRVHHLQARSAAGLARALAEAWRLGRHAVLEVSLRADDQAARNLAQHRAAEAACRAATRAALALLPPLTIEPTSAAASSALAIASVELAPYELPLAAPLTAGPGGGVRSGALLRVTLACGAAGLGDVAPLPGLHAETLPQALAQAALLAAQLPGAVLCPSVAMLDGSLAAWMVGTAGIARPDGLHPSVRFGLEAALLSALASARGTGLASLLCAGADACGTQAARAVAVNALVDAAASPADGARLAASGHGCVKLKVARPGGTPAGDAARCAALRAALGPRVALRVDANRGWSLPEALAFADACAESAVELEYIEEPLRDPAGLPDFFELAKVPIALDESVDEGRVGARAGVPPPPGAPASAASLPPGCTALVIKPSVVGGLERAAALARWARRRGAAAVISSAFESSVGLAALAALAAAVDGKAAAPVAHGLATAAWFAADVAEVPLEPRAAPGAGAVIDVADGSAAAALTGGSAALRRIAFAPPPPLVAHTHDVRTAAGGHYALRVLTPASSEPPQPPQVLFLHGFLGDGHDWAPLMAAVAAATGASVAAVDLPGHGGSRALQGAQGVPEVAAALAALIEKLRAGHAAGPARPPPPTVVGYSMGARVALQMALQHSETVSAVVCVSGTAGVRGAAARRARAARDDALGRALRVGGAASFASGWYMQRMFAPLASRPRFAELEARRAAGRDADALADALAAASPGRAPDLWPLLAAAPPRAGNAPPLRIHFVAGALDPKFAAAARKMARTAGAGVDATAHEVAGSGHAVHLEAPEALLSILLHALSSSE